MKWSRTAFDPLARVGAWLTFLCLIAPGCSAPKPVARQPDAGALARFEVDRPAAARLLAANPTLRTWVAEAFNTTVDGYRMIWSNEPPVTGALAEHGRHARERLLVIRVSSNLTPPDQIVACLFELLNARQLPRFMAIEERAKRGALTKDQFIDAILRVEHAPVVTLKSRFFDLCPLTEDELAQTRLCRSLREAPTDYEAFRAWRSSQPAHQAARARYELYFDTLLKGSLP